MFGLINLKGKQTQTPIHIFAVEMYSKKQFVYKQKLEEKNHY